MKKIDFVDNRKTWFSISLIMMVATVLATVVLGVKLDIQFSGGTMVTYAFDGTIDKNEFDAAAEAALGGKQVSVREQQDVVTSKTGYVVTLADKNGISPDEQIALNEALAAKYPQSNIQSISISNVNSTIGADFMGKSIFAVVLAAVLMIGYIAFRFRKMNGWSAGVISVLALIHDLVIVYAVFVICGFPLNDSFIAVLLTILGYSINNTIIIYDRIRENKATMKRLNYCALVNLSVNQSMGRSINTSISTVLSILIVCILSIIYGVNSILTFALPLLIGMLAGFFSSVFIAGPLWGWWQERKLTAPRRAG